MQPSSPSSMASSPQSCTTKVTSQATTSRTSITMLAHLKTQMHVREILASQFHTGPGGLPGNDDAGQMSAWYVLSAIGFYPLCPGMPAYTLGSPIFSRIVIHQSNGKDFTVLAPRNS